MAHFQGVCISAEPPNLLKLWLEGVNWVWPIWMLLCVRIDCRPRGKVAHLQGMDMLVQREVSSTISCWMLSGLLKSAGRSRRKVATMRISTTTWRCLSVLIWPSPRRVQGEHHFIAVAQA